MRFGSHGAQSTSLRPPRHLPWAELAELAHDLREEAVHGLAQAERAGNVREGDRLRRLLAQTERFINEHGIA